MDNGSHYGERLPLLCGCATYDSYFRKGLEYQLQKNYKGRWKALNFSDLEESLVTKLSDGDFGAFLVCIDAVSLLTGILLSLPRKKVWSDFFLQKSVLRGS